jgi:hypothetical protein
MDFQTDDALLGQVVLVSGDEVSPVTFFQNVSNSFDPF